MDPAFQAVVDAGIPLVIYIAGGIEAAGRLGAMNHVGAVDYQAGVAGGEYPGEAGAANGVYVNSLPGAANIEDYRNGFIEGMESTGGTAEQLPLPATAQGNVSAVAQAVQAHRLRNPEVDAVLTTANLDAVGTAQAGKQGQVKLGGINFDEVILNQIFSGAQDMAVDQQGYQQGLYAESILDGAINYGLSIPTREILTGPGIVDAANIEATMAGAEQGTR